MAGLTAGVTPRPIPDLVMPRMQPLLMVRMVSAGDSAGAEALAGAEDSAEADGGNLLWDPEISPGVNSPGLLSRSPCKNRKTSS
jgi:hypothetical protein